MIDGLVNKAQKALSEYMKLDQEQINNIVHEMALAGLEHHMDLAKLAVEETGRGIVEDKIIKNMFSTEYIWHSIKYEKTVGVIEKTTWRVMLKSQSLLALLRLRHLLQILPQQQCLNV